MEPSLYRQIFELQETHWWFEARRQYFDLFLKGKNISGNILDVGTGPGSMLAFLSRYGSVVGLDPFHPALRMARLHFQGPLIQGKVEALPFPDNHFSLISVCEVLYHRAVQNLSQAVGELKRVLKPGGLLIVVDSAYPSLKSAHDMAAHMARRFTLTELCQLMSGSGLRVVHATYAYALLLPVVWVVRRLKALKKQDRQPKAEIKATPPLLNRLLINWFYLEARINSRLKLPFGLSVQVISTKDVN